MEANNEAAIREALEAINSINTAGLKRLLVELVEADIFDGGLINKTISAVEKARRALSSAPARNCDVFKSEVEANSAFIEYYNEAYGLKGSKYAIDTCDLKHNVNDILHDYIEWLFAKVVNGKEWGNEEAKELQRLQGLLPEPVETRVRTGL